MKTRLSRGLDPVTESLKKMFRTTLGGCLCNKWISNFLPHLRLTSAHFRGELQHVDDVSEQKFKYGLIRTREITDIRMLHKPCVR